MPFVEDYSEDEDKAGGAGGDFSAGGGGGSGGGASGARPSKQTESAYVPWSRFTSANADVSAREAGKLNSQVQGDIDRTKTATADASSAFTAGIEQNYAHDGDKRTGPRSQTDDERRAGAPGGFGSTAPFSQAPVPETQDQTLAGMKARNASGGTFGQAPTGSAPVITADAQQGTRIGLKPGAVNAPVGPKDLETSLGPTGWGSLMGDATRAESEANALGSESGVQGLLQQQATAPLAQNGAFDAALINGAAGSSFGKTSQAGQGLLKGIGAANQSAQGAWSSLMGDVDEAKRQAAATTEAEATNAKTRAQQAASGAPGTAAAAETAAPKWKPEGYPDLRSFMDQGEAGEYAHEVAMDLNPFDWATRGLGEAGVYNGENTSQAFAGAFGADGNENGDWQTGNLRSAARLVQAQYGEAAMQYWYEHLTPEMWAAYGEFGNAGAMARQIRAWLDSVPQNVQQNGWKDPAGKPAPSQPPPAATPNPAGDDPDGRY